MTRSYLSTLVPCVLDRNSGGWRRGSNGDGDRKKKIKNERENKREGGKRLENVRDKEWIMKDCGRRWGRGVPASQKWIRNEDLKREHPSDIFCHIIHFEFYDRVLCFLHLKILACLVMDEDDNHQYISRYSLLLPPCQIWKGQDILENDEEAVIMENARNSDLVSLSFFSILMSTILLVIDCICFCKK